jgi:DNA-binding winged helix-turn-helix (wHTH) protein/tetratricopeptide (TPR) repeat protein
MKLFQSFRLDTANHCLWRAEDRVPLTPKAFDVLRYLVEHPARVVSQDEILEAVWPETYVNPEVIKKYILEIRKVLGNQPDRPEFIATFPKRGYQFVAAVSDQSASQASDLGAETPGKMVGRETALAELDSRLEKVVRGQRQVVFVTGEAGIGKTTLVDVFQQRAARRPNLRMARGQCVEGFGGKEAYYPILEALSHLMGDEEDGPLVRILAQRAPTWLIQFPSLVKAEHREALQREIIGATRERMVREICEVLEALTAENPFLLILEDLHWVDPSTLDLISALARRRGPAKLVVLGTYRPAEVVIAQSPLKGLKQDLLVHHLCGEIALERLEEPEIAEYLAGEFGSADFPSGLASLIYRHSGGNPLFMVAIVEDMVKKGLIAQDEGRWALTTPLEEIAPGVPETLQRMLEVQFEQLSAPEQQVLKSASVAGERFSVWAITPILEMETEHLEDLCEGLTERQQFIRSVGIRDIADGVASAHYEFRHSLYREVLYRRLSEVNRSKLHRSLGERLERLCTPGKQDFVSELALHFQEGRSYERAIEYLLRTAQNADRRFAHRDSIHILQHALELVPKIASNSRTGAEVRILERLGDAHYALGEMEESARAYQREADRAAQAGLIGTQVNALSCLARPAGFIDPDGGIAVCDQATQVSVTLDDPLLLARTRILASSTRLLYDAWRKEDAEVCAAASREVQDLGHSALSAFEESLYAHVLSLQGDYGEVLRRAGPNLSDTAETTSLVVYSAALVGRALALLHLGHLGEVLRIARMGGHMAEKNGNDPWCCVFRCLEAWLRTIAFDFENARQLCEITMSSEAERSARRPKTVALLFTGYAELELGRSEKAVLCFKQILDQPLYPRYFLQWYWRMSAQLGLSNAWLASGNIAEARHVADTFLAAALATADPSTQALAWEMKARVAMAEKDLAGAEDCVGNAQTILQKFEIPNAAWRVHATAWQLYRRAKNGGVAEANRARAQACILKIANSFAEDEPLRETFLSARPVARILGASANKGAVGGA